MGQAASPTPVGILSISLPSRASFLPAPTFPQTFHSFSAARFNGFKSHFHFGHIGCVTLDKLFNLPES